MAAWSLQPPAADGVRLDQPSYERDFARGLYESGEDVESYFAREIAHLPPPPRVAPPPRPDVGRGR